MWIESHTDLENHPKTLLLQRYLDCSLNEALGVLHRFWWWCLRYCEDGQLDKYGSETIGAAIGVDAKALIDAGWIDVKPRFQVHDWWDYTNNYWRSKYKHNEPKWKRIKRFYGPVKQHTKNGSSNGDKNLTPLPTFTYLNQPNQPTTVSPNGESVAPKPETEIQKLIKGWKMLSGVPTEGPESQSWDKVHFPRCSASAKRLITLFGYKEAVNCMEYVYLDMKKKNLTCTLETTVKCSDLYREQLARSGR